jgi:hypothetical protein
MTVSIFFQRDVKNALQIWRQLVHGIEEDRAA